VIATKTPEGALGRERFDGQGRSIERLDPDGSRHFRLLDGNGNPVRVYRYEPVLVAGNPVRLDVFVEDHEFDEQDRVVSRIFRTFGFGLVAAPIRLSSFAA